MQRRNRNLNPVLFASALVLAAVAACGAERETTSVEEIAETQQAADPLPFQAPEESTSTPVVFPPAQNPLTGLPVEDPSLLDLPAALVSISHFPVNARPQAGLSFAPWVFEIYITEGATRFLAVFYGEFPEPEHTVNGDCPVRREPFQQTSDILGNRVWLEENGNDTQDAWERGVGGVCVNLYDESGTLLQQTATDSNGYYGFNVEAGRYIVEFKKPPWMEFVQKNAGDEESDSDADQLSGRSEAVDVNSSLLHVDAGLILSSNPFPVSELPPAKVGPIRSGRLVYADIAAFFPESCLIYAFASAEVLVELPQCFFVHHDIQGGGYMLEIEQLKRLAEERKGGKFNYASNVFEPIPPEGGAAASRLHVYIAYLNQSAWVYDALSESYWRYVDNADMETAGYVHPEVERLTNRQLHFENVVVIFTEHDVISPTNLDIHLEANRSGRGLLFRDGRMYEIHWSTHVSDEELQSGRRKPIRFISKDGSALFPLKPGRTWILVVTPYTSVTERDAGEWLLQFVQPAGAK